MVFALPLALADKQTHTSNSVWLEIVLIVAAVIVVAAVIAGVLMVTGKLGSRVPGRNPQPPTGQEPAGASGYADQGRPPRQGSARPGPPRGRRGGPGAASR